MSKREFWVQGDLRSLLHEDLNAALREVDKLAAERLLSEDPTIIIANIVKKFERALLVPDFDKKEYGKAREVITKINDFGRVLEVNGLAVDVVLPISGDTSVLRYQATSWSPSPIDWKIEEHRLVLTVERPDLNSEIVKDEYEKSLSLLNLAIGWANSDLIQSRTQMAGEINARLSARREKIQKAKNIDVGLNLA